jgi:hypothetical protein
MEAILFNLFLLALFVIAILAIFRKFSAWSEKKKADLAVDRLRAFKANLEIETSKKVFDSNIDVTMSNNGHQILKNYHEQTLFVPIEKTHQAKAVSEQARSRTALAEAERAEAETEQFIVRLRDSQD